MSVLGTDGFGRSDTREACCSSRSTPPTLWSPCSTRWHETVKSAAGVAEAITTFGIDPNRPDPPTPTRAPGSACREIVRPGTLWITGEPEVDDLINTDPLKLLIGMLLDQQIAIELAFRPSRLKARLGNTLDAATIADWTPTFGDLRREASIASLSGSMAGRIQELCRHVADTYDGDASRICKRRRTSTRLLRTLRPSPGTARRRSRSCSPSSASGSACPPAGGGPALSATTSRARLPTWAAPRNDSPCAPGRRRRRRPVKPSTSESRTNS